MKRPRLLLILAVLTNYWCIGLSSAQNNSSLSEAEIAARIDAIFAEHARSDAPGCAVGIAMNGEPVFMKGYGLASLEHGVPITPQTAFNLGSVCKQFTAMALLLLEQRGKVSLDHDVRTYVPAMPDYGTPIRVGDLLYHTSGLRDYGTLETLSGAHLRTMDDFLDLMSRQRGLNFTPGSRHAYSHSDYGLLALVIESIAGEPLGDFLTREIWKPLGMTSTRLADDRRLAIRGQAFAYAASGVGYRIRFPDSSLIGGNNVYSTVADLLKWERNFHTATVGGRAILDRMLSRPTTDSGLFIPYAFGLMHNEYRGLPIVQRSGGGGGFSTEMMRFPKHGLTVFTLSNTSPTHPKLLSQAVAEIFLGDKMEALTVGIQAPSTPVPPQELEQYAGLYQPIDAPWDTMKIVARDGKLCEMYAGKEYELTRGPDGRYRYEGLTFAFSPSTDDGPVRLTFLDENMSSECVRRPTSEMWKPPAEALHGYIGSFYSEDLGVVWNYSVADGTLMLRRPRDESRPMSPIDPDLFSSELGVSDEPFLIGVQFKRDGNGRVTGFSVSAIPDPYEVARDIRFERMTLD